MGLLTLAVLLWFYVTSATQVPAADEFLLCLSDHASAYTIISDTIHSRKDPLYQPLLESFQQNPRWLNSTDAQALFILTPTQVSEIQAAVICSVKHGIQVRVVSGGHDYEGQSFLCKTQFIIIYLIYLRSITINLEDETVWVQSGATLGELYYSIAKKSSIHGFPAGICPSVGVGGHFSGGGFGPMLRKHGLAADNVVDAYLIDVNGRIMDRELMGEDLFWAIRGGGAASFGIIVSWKIKLVRIPPVVTVFDVNKRLDQGATRLVHTWQYIASNFSKDLFIRIIIQNVGGNGAERTIQATFNSLYLGKVDELLRLLDRGFPELGLAAENCTEMSWIESVLVIAGYERGQPLEVLLDRRTKYKSYFKAKSDFVKEPIPEIGLEGVWERFLEEEFVYMIMDPYGGRMSEIPESEVPFPHRHGNLYNIQYIVKWDVNEIEEANEHIKWLRMLYKYMKPYVSLSPRGAYLNYRDLDLGMKRQGNGSYSDASIWGRMYYKYNFERLVQVKNKVDPDNFFRNKQSIPSILAMGKRKYS